MTSKVEYLIVDTSAFIKNASLQDIGNKIITEPNVVNEIKSKRQLRRLIVLPYDLEVKEAFAEDIKFVSEFAKKTGDYASLSATDIKVIALTYRFEREKVGVDHLKTAPTSNKQVVDSSLPRPEDHPKNLAGFYLPDKKSEAKDGVAVEKSKKQDDSPFKEEPTPKENSESDLSTDNVQFSADNELSEDSPSDYESKGDLCDLNKKFQDLKCDPSQIKVECGDDLTVDDILKPMDDNEDEAGYEEDDEDDDDDDNADDDSGWITPGNIIEVKRKMDSNVVSDKPTTVACLTTDFAMQNVLMQIGLNISSLDGKVIKHMRTWILRCYSCFKTTSITTKVFCPSCGHKTLKKVSVSLDENGQQKIHINFRKPLTSKGKKFSLPAFQGGKHGCNPILFEDQPCPDQRPSQKALIKNDPLKEEYIAGYSPFVTRDVTSKSAILGIRSGRMGVKHWMKKNPNEAFRPRK